MITSNSLLKPMPPSPVEGMSFTIRSARAEDIGQVTELDAAITGLLKSAHWNGILNTRDAEADLQFFLVAMNGSQLLGFIIGEARAWEFGSPPCGWIYTVAVDSRARLNSVASALFEEMCARFRRAGVTKVRTMIARDAQLVLSFFRSQGMMAGPFIELEKDLDE